MSNRRSGKDAAANDDTDGGVATEEAPPKDRTADWVNGETRIIEPTDKALLLIGAKLIRKSCKTAVRLNTSLDIARGAADQRDNEASALIDLIHDVESAQGVTVPPHLLRCAQLGIYHEIGKVSKAKKEQESLSIEDTRGTDKRLKDLEALARHLGIQGDLGLDDDEDEDDDQAELDVD